MHKRKNNDRRSLKPAFSDFIRNYRTLREKSEIRRVSKRSSA